MPRTTDNRRLLAVCALLCGATLAAFWGVRQCGFINFDDLEYVVENDHVTSGLNFANIAWAFTAGYAGNWHPLTWISHMADAQFFGLDAAAHHTTNLLLHTANALLLLLLLRRMTGSLWRSA